MTKSILIRCVEVAYGYGAQQTNNRIEPKDTIFAWCGYRSLPKPHENDPGPLKIEKIWDHNMSEKSLLLTIMPLFLGSPWKFIPVGNNLVFDFKFLATKIKKYFDFNATLDYFISPHVPFFCCIGQGKWLPY